MTAIVVPTVDQDRVEGVIGRGFLGPLEKYLQIQVLRKLIPAHAHMGNMRSGYREYSDYITVVV